MIELIREWWNQLLLPECTEATPTQAEKASPHLSLSKAYELESEIQILRGARLVLVYALTLFPLFGFLDYFTVPPDALGQVLTIRFATEMILGIIWLLTYEGWAKRHSSSLGAAVIYLCGLSITLMTLSFEDGFNTYYYGLNLSLIVSAIIPWGALPTAIVCAALGLTYMLSHLLSGVVSSTYFASFIGNNFLLGSTAVIITGVNWLSHRLRFEAFRARFNQNRAYSELHLANEELSQKHKEVQAKTSQLADVNKKLNEKSSELQGSNNRLAEQYRVKSQFLDNISHELRTPLTCILTPVEALLAGNVQGELRKTLEGMRGSGEQLLDLINDLLQASKYENSDVPLKLEKVDPRAIVLKVLDSWRLQAKTRGIHLRTEIPDDLPPMLADRREAATAIQNPLANAFKFTPEGGAVGIRLRTVNDQIEISIRDSGPGIPEEQLPKLGTPFFQVDSSQTRAHAGTGLGLTLVKNIMERHGGGWEVRSKVDVGTMVNLRFPITDGVADEEYEADEMDDSIPPMQIEQWEQIDGEGAENKSIPGLFGLSEMAKLMPGLNIRPRVLVVEDNPNLVELLTRILAPIYDVVSARDGRDGLEKVREGKPDLIISDVMMPNMTGTELLQAIRSDKELERVPFILLTARADGPDRARGLWNGANDYITKPFIPQELLARINNLLRIQQFEHFLTDINRELEEKSETLEGRLHRLFIDTVRVLVKAIDAKDYYTGGHSERVAHFALIIAQALDISPEQRRTLELGALLHDIGKIGVPDRILNKSGNLTLEEVKIIREHPLNSAKILEGAPELSELRTIAMYHHERWDGKGYPYGLKGEETPLSARIVAMADCWDAMISDRVYRPGMAPQVAVAKIQKMAGNQIDPTVVEALCKVYPQLKEVPEHIRPPKQSHRPTENRAPMVGALSPGE